MELVSYVQLESIFGHLVYLKWSVVFTRVFVKSHSYFSIRL